MSGFDGKLAIEFLSDWHCGSGAGEHAGIDRTIRLDHNGFPFVPGRTLRGLWRDAAETAARALDDGSQGEWSELAGYIFGDPKLAEQDPLLAQAALAVRPAYLSGQWHRALCSNSEEKALLTEALRIERSAVAIMDDTGTAAPDHLRLIEFARAGLQLEADIHLRVELDWQISLLLQASLKLLDHVGSFRRRGAGRASLTLHNADGSSLETLPQLLKAHQDEVASFRISDLPELQTAPTPTLAPTGTRAPAVELVHAFDLTFVLKQPAVCTRSVRGNTIMSHDYLPGATVLPIIAQAIGNDASSLIRSNQLVVTPAHPVVSQDGQTGIRSAATPLVLTSPDKGRAWHDNAEAVVDLRASANAADPTRRPIRGWCGIAADAFSGNLTIGSVELVTIAHASIDDDQQRTLTNGLYALQAIAAGTVLRSEVWLPHGTDQKILNSIQTMNGQQVSVGRYRHGDYGFADLQVTAVDSRPSDNAKTDQFTVWLESDAVLLNEFGQADASEEQLTKAIRELLAAQGIDTELFEASLLTNRIDSWTATTALPRPSIIGLAAGSVATFLIENGEFALAKIETALAQGIGVRRAEGFGRVRLLHEPRTGSSWAAIQSTPFSVRSNSPDDDENLDDWARASDWDSFRRMAWRDEILRRMRDLAVREADDILPGTSLSNLGTLRRAAIELAADDQAVERWIAGIENRPSMQATWAECLASTGFVAAVGRPKAVGQFEPVPARWTHRIAGRLNALDEQPQVPTDLAGNDPQELASIFLVEVAQQKARRLQSNEKTGAAS